MAFLLRGTGIAAVTFIGLPLRGLHVLGGAMIADFLGVPVGSFMGFPLGSFPGLSATDLFEITHHTVVRQHEKHNILGSYKNVNTTYSSYIVRIRRW